MLTILENGFVFITLCQLYLFIQQMRALSYLKNDYTTRSFEDRDASLKSYEVWIQLEILLRIGILSSCFVYMLIRKCFRERMVVTVKSPYEIAANRKNKKSAQEVLHKAHESVDFLQGARWPIGLFSSVSSPFFMNVFSRWICDIIGNGNEKHDDFFLWITIALLVQGAIPLPIIFIKNQKGYGFRLYTRAVLVCTLAVIPVFVCTLIGLHWADIRDKANKSVYVFLLCNQIFMVVYITLITFPLLNVEFSHFKLTDDSISYPQVSTSSTKQNGNTEALLGQS